MALEVLQEGSGSGWFNGPGDRYLAFRSGRLAFIWPEKSSWVRIVPCDPDGRPSAIDDIAALLIEAPVRLSQEPGPFTEFCREWVGLRDAIDAGQARALLNMMAGRPNAYALAPVEAVLLRIAGETA